MTVVPALHAVAAAGCAHVTAQPHVFCCRAFYMFILESHLFSLCSGLRVLGVSVGNLSFFLEYLVLTLPEVVNAFRHLIQGKDSYRGLRNAHLLCS